MTYQQPSLYNYAETTQELRIKTLDEMENVCKQCFKCELSKTRNNVVFSDGNKNAKIMLIGEAPGRTEDETGKPFVGRAGKLLDKILESQDITREKNIYICNTVKCRPPENRVPTPQEKEACRSYLDAQIQLIRPKIILLAGATAVKSMMDTKLPISKIRGQWFEGPLESKIMPIFHPSYLLRNDSKEPGTPKWLMWQDMKEIRRVMDSLT
jgi:uracil-DNA glycosylase